MPAEERGNQEGADPIGWGKAEEDAHDDDVTERVDEGQIRRQDEPAGREREHQPEERDRGA
jgi:hypothetical protein